MTPWWHGLAEDLLGMAVIALVLWGLVVGGVIAFGMTVEACR